MGTATFRHEQASGLDTGWSKWFWENDFLSKISEHRRSYLRETRMTSHNNLVLLLQLLRLHLRRKNWLTKSDWSY
jgi:hypothetical protein